MGISDSVIIVEIIVPPMFFHTEIFYNQRIQHNMNLLGELAQWYNVCITLLLNLFI